jgi:hypothetical protein
MLSNLRAVMLVLLMGRFMKYAIEIGLRAMIYSYIPNFIKSGLGVEKLRGMHM